MTTTDNMWTCLKCNNDNSTTASFCAFCGLPRATNPPGLPGPAPRANLRAVERRYSLAANPDFPVAVPVLLKLSEGALRGIAAVIGIVLGLVLSLAVYFLADPSGMTGRIV